MNRVAGKVALVSGASSGLGESAARMLASEGATVVLADINDEAGEKVAREIETEGGKAIYTHLDVSREDDWVRVMELTKRSFGGLNITVNCAGINQTRISPTDETVEALHRVMSVNMDGVFLGTKHSVALMSETQPVTGSIVNVSSMAGLVGFADLGAYCASKGAVRMYTKSAALSCAARGLKIRVNSVHPGIIDTPLLRKAMQFITTPDEAERVYASMQPVGHMGQPVDVAFGILYLASDEARFVTGAELVIDGGYTAR